VGSSWEHCPRLLLRTGGLVWVLTGHAVLLMIFFQTLFILFFL
jgi:hypothetical protein